MWENIIFSSGTTTLIFYGSQKALANIMDNNALMTKRIKCCSDKIHTSVMKVLSV